MVVPRGGAVSVNSENCSAMHCTRGEGIGFRVEDVPDSSRCMSSQSSSLALRNLEIQGVSFAVSAVKTENCPAMHCARGEGLE